MATISTASTYYNKIDTSFPVAGQDNDSQGFRSNFQNTYNAFSNLDADLQSSKINSAKLNSNNDFSFTGTVVRAVIENSAFLASSSVPITGNLDYSIGNYHKASVSGNTTFEVRNWPPTGNFAAVRLEVRPTTSTEIIINFSAGAGQLYTDGNDVLPYYSTDIAPIYYDIWSSDNGDTVMVKQIGNATTGTTGEVVGAQKITQPVTDNTSTNYATTEFVHNVLPKGTILMWSGAKTAIPTGWALCDGLTHSGVATPNLQNKFILGAGDNYNVGNIGGSEDAIVVSHSHSITDNGHRHFVGTSVDLGGGSGNTLSASNSLARANGGDYLLQGSIATPTVGLSNTATTGISVDTQGIIGTGANMPPYYALCFIIKITGD